MRDAILDGAGTPFDWPEAIGFGRAPFASLPAGAWECVAGPDGVAVGCFGWTDPDTGQVFNAQIANALMGIVMPHANPYNLWERVYIRYAFPFSQMVIRPGVRCIVASLGDFQIKFPDGGEVGTQVFADPTTGLPYSGNTLGSLVPTPWTLAQRGNAGSRLLVTQSAKPFN